MLVSTISKDIKNIVNNKGYALISAKNFEFCTVAKKHLDDFVKDWDDLVIDNFLKDNGRYRFRRYGRFNLNSQDRTLVRSTDEEYFQSVNNNPVNGGIQRKFASLTEQRYDDEFLKKLIMLDFDNFPMPTEHHLWQVGVHQIRIIAGPEKMGYPTPEGPHKDGEMFTVQHFIQRRNVDGGNFTIYDNKHKKIEDWTQYDLLDSVYFRDSDIYHGVSQIAATNNHSNGIRDTLLIDFDPLKIKTEKLNDNKELRVGVSPDESKQELYV